MKLPCKHCGKDGEVKFKTLKLNNGVEKTYFNCPNCNHEYIAYMRNEIVTEKQNKVKELVNKSKQLNITHKEKTRMAAAIRKLDKEIMNEIEHLKEKYN